MNSNLNTEHENGKNINKGNLYCNISVPSSCKINT